MATPKSQRIFIWVIAVVMAVGTLGAYFIAILADSNGAVPSAQELAYKKQMEQMQKACPTTDAKPIAAINPAPTPPEVAPVDAIPELKTEDVTVGAGEEAKEGSCVEILFHGVIAKTATPFQGGDNYAQGAPYRSVTTGFVPGFAKGLVGMKVGGERKIYIPSAQGYGPQAVGEIPADSDLVFVVRLTGIYHAQ